MVPASGWICDSAGHLTWKKGTLFLFIRLKFKGSHAFENYEYKCMIFQVGQMDRYDTSGIVSLNRRSY